jgi:hypothetical protein
MIRPEHPSGADVVELIIEEFRDWDAALNIHTSLSALIPQFLNSSIR